MGRSHHGLGNDPSLLTDPILQYRKAVFFHCFRRVVYELGRRCARARTVYERERDIEAYLVDEPHGGVEIRVSLARKTDDEIRRQADVGSDEPQFSDLRFILQHRVTTLHRGKNAIRTRLHWQVQVIDELRYVAVGLDEIVSELDRMRRRVANAFDALDVRDVVDDFGEIGMATVDGATIRIDVLPEQVDFPHPLLAQLHDFSHDIGDRTAHLFTAGIGDHTETAIFRAAFHDRNERRGTFRSRCR